MSTFTALHATDLSCVLHSVLNTVTYQSSTNRLVPQTPLRLALTKVNSIYRIHLP